MPSNQYMKYLKETQVDKSWMKEYENYLHRFSDGHRTKKTSDIVVNRSTLIADSHTSTLSNLLNVVTAKKPIQNIYKRPI